MSDCTHFPIWRLNEELAKNADEVLHERFAGNTSFELTKEKVTALLKHFG